MLLADIRVDLPAGVVEDDEKADDSLIGGVMAGEVKTVAADPEPVAWSVVRIRMEEELGFDELPEGYFRGGEHGVNISAQAEKADGLLLAPNTGMSARSFVMGREALVLPRLYHSGWDNYGGSALVLR